MKQFHDISTELAKLIRYAQALYMGTNRWPKHNEPQTYWQEVFKLCYNDIILKRELTQELELELFSYLFSNEDA